jgi:hypothetical protein
VKSFYFGRRHCAYCLGSIGRLRLWSDVVKVFVPDDIIGLDKEVLIPNGFQKMHKTCVEKALKDDPKFLEVCKK